MNHSTEAKLTVARNVYALLESEAAWAQGAAAFNKGLSPGLSDRQRGVPVVRIGRDTPRGAPGGR